MFGRWRQTGRRLTVAVAVAVVVGALGVLVTAPSVHAQDDDLRTRLEAACARIPTAEARLDELILRLDGPLDARGSLAWFEDAIARATANGRTRIAADLQRRFDRLSDRRALLDVRQSQLDRFATRCAELGAAG